MDSDWFEEESFFTTLAGSQARALVIGRRGLIVLGAPVLTNDYDLWIHFDDVEKLNAAFRELDLEPNKTPAQARATGRYVLEGGAHVDVMIARAQSTRDDATRLTFDEAWARRRSERVGKVTIHLPSLADYVLTKRWSLRPRDVQDIVFLRALEAHERDVLAGKEKP